MAQSYPVFGHSRLVRLIVVLMLLVVLLSTSACEGDAQVRQQAMESEQRFWQLLHSAEQLGFTPVLLQPILQQDALLRATQPPFSLFSNQPIDVYYRGLSQRYTLLFLQLRGLMDSNTQSLRSNTAHQLLSLRSTVDQERKDGLPAGNFSPQLDQLQRSLDAGQGFEAIAHVRMGLQDVALALQMLRSTSTHLQALQDLVVLTQLSGLQTSVLSLQSSDQENQQRFRHAASIASLQTLDGRIAAQQQQGEATLQLAIPTITDSRLHDLTEGVQQLPAVHLDASTYQTNLATYKKQAATSMNVAEFRQFLRHIDGDILAIRSDTLRENAQLAFRAFHKDVDGWSGRHLYYDQYDGTNYAIDTSYLNQNFGLDAETQLEDATSLNGLRSAIDTSKILLFNHQLMELDAVDTTPYDQVHRADQLALQHYHLQKGQVIIISLSKQALRLYQDGKLVRAFLVTTGRPERPSPPGVWTIINRLSPTEFKSSDPPSSPYWYPDTTIQTAILFRDGGYFIHDSWWRYNYGPGTEFPHYDASGNQRSAGNGSHGCVNLPPDEAAWIYNHTGWNTTIVVY
ncbi:hypothetical protein KDA_20030 [Dictyobacter alpinus]|uniref:L,D-TPase catalytic domain-containing protein n=1 Tax=Dictyobacter alpinus TaxID=2014873 RepID=A0A402B595_9CHLR|nr:L,D-transpeptidase [Dictyobacter alpinus]GCE26519.1 hypothetical protein KDA_20030 [Dictyobacter alpinus]